MTIEIMTEDELRVKLADRRLSYVAEKCGLSYMSLTRITKGTGRSKLDTLEKLTEYFKENK